MREQLVLLLFACDGRWRLCYGAEPRDQSFVIGGILASFMVRCRDSVLAVGIHSAVSIFSIGVDQNFPSVYEV